MSKEIKVEFGDLLKNAFGRSFCKVKGNNYFKIDVDKLEFEDEELETKESKELDCDKNFTIHKVFVNPCPASEVISGAVCHIMADKFNVDGCHSDGKLKFKFINDFSPQMLLDSGHVKAGGYPSSIASFTDEDFHKTSIPLEEFKKLCTGKCKIYFTWSSVTIITMTSITATTTTGTNNKAFPRFDLKKIVAY